MQVRALHNIFRHQDDEIIAEILIFLNVATGICSFRDIAGSLPQINRNDMFAQFLKVIHARDFTPWRARTVETTTDVGGDKYHSSFPQTSKRRYSHGSHSRKHSLCAKCNLGRGNIELPKSYTTMPFVLWHPSPILSSRRKGRRSSTFPPKTTSIAAQLCSKLPIRKDKRDSPVTGGCDNHFAKPNTRRRFLENSGLLALQSA